MTVRPTITAIAEILGRYELRAAKERSLQLHVQAALEHDGIRVASAAPSAADRYDLFAELGDTAGPVRPVLKPKLAASAPAVERQAQRYALAADVDGIVVVTSSTVSRTSSASQWSVPHYLFSPFGSGGLKPQSHRFAFEAERRESKSSGAPFIPDLSIIE